MDWARLLVSAVAAGIIAGTGAILAAVADGTAPTETQWLIAIAVASGSAAKDIQALLAQSPRQTES